MFDGTAPAFAAAEDKRSSKAINWAGVAFEHLWHVILGQRKDMLPTCNPCGRYERTNEYWVTQDTDGLLPSDNRHTAPITKRRPNPRPRRY